VEHESDRCADPGARQVRIDAEAPCESARSGDQVHRTSIGSEGRQLNGPRAAGWFVIIAVLGILAWDGVRYLRVKQALNAGVSSAVAKIASRPDLLESFASARRFSDEDKWGKLRDYERAAVEAGNLAALGTGGVTDARTHSRAQLMSFVTSSPFWKNVRRTTLGAAIIRPGECAGGQEAPLSSCRLRYWPGDPSITDAERHVTVLMAARFSGLIPLYPPIAVQASQDVRVR